MKWLIYGHKGWIGSFFINFLRRDYSDIEIVYPSSRVEDIDNVSKDLDEYKPDRVLSFIGRTSGPGFNTIDYLEQKGKIKENVRDNLFCPIILMKLCSDRNIHFTYLGTGCIYSYENPTDEPFTVDSKPNFFGSSYSTVKGFTDQLSKIFPNILNARIRMPITSMDHPKNFISKIIRYPKICNTLNSMTVLDDAIPVLISEILIKTTGTINLVNPEPIDHITILELYKKYIDPCHTYTLITEEEQNKILLSERSKNVLIPSLNLPPTRNSVEQIFKSGTFKKV
jgi:nucleoside-diphosphate-sugar epimerase